jgi:RNA-binding protein
MNRQELRKQAHDLDVTLWVGKGGIDPVADLADRTGAEVVETRGNTGVLYR